VLALGLGSALGAAGEPPAVPAEASPRATMRELFADLRVLLPLSVQDDAFRAAANQERIRAALADLAARADELAQHSRADAPRFRHLGASLARDARDAARSFTRGHPEHAQFLIRELTENCVACHAALPSPGDSPLAEVFVSGTALAGLPPLERARIQIATRRFDDALATLEEVLTSTAFHPAELLSPLTDYLTLALRVKGDFERPVPVLERFAARPDLWRHLRLDVEAWLRALRELPARSGADAGLPEARALLDDARRQIRFPADRAALVHYVVASRILHGLVAKRDVPVAERSEAYYLLGLIESRIGRDEWVSQAGQFLEAAIRSAPHGPFAEQAYATLEEETLLDYGVALDEPLPEDVAANLAELRRLIDSRDP
jgi:hypothetical protein